MDKPIETKVMIAADGRQRSEMVGGSVHIMDASSRIRLTLHPDMKQATVYAIDEKSEARKHNQLKWLQDLKAHADKPDEELGKKELNGRNVQGYVTKQGGFAYTIWVDSKTRELVQVENGAFVEGSTVTKVEMTDFQFNASLDESLFSYEIPKGYQSQQQAVVPNVPGGEASIIEALRGFTKVSEGKFPKSITEWGEWAVVFSKDNQNGQPTAEATKVMAHLGSIIPFLVGRSQDDYEYLGAGKTSKDPRCIIFWYRTDDKKLRAIYNDLKAAEVQESDLP